jgi:hypothetical protein
MDLVTYYPGQKVTIFLETLDGYGVRQDCAVTPTINRIIFPNFIVAPGYPQLMLHVDTGLYYFQFTLPTGASAVGSYLVDAGYVRPADGYSVVKAYQIVVISPYGNYSATIGN